MTLGERVINWLVRLVRHLWREMLGFGAVGLVGVVCDITTFNLIIGVAHGPKVVGSLVGTAIGTVISYLGNRFWVFRHRDRRESAVEISLYVLVSTVAMGIIAVCVAVNEYGLGNKGLIAANIAQFVVGQILGSVFRFWALHMFVFPESRANGKAGGTDKAAETAASPRPPSEIGPDAAMLTQAQLAEAE